MRYTRLKRQFEDGTLLGTRGTAFCPRNTKKVIGKKRGRPCKNKTAPSGEASRGNEASRKQELNDVECFDPTISSMPFAFARSAGDNYGSRHSEFRRSLSPSPPISSRSQQPNSELPRQMNLTSGVPPPPFQIATSSASLAAADGTTMTSRDGSSFFSKSQQGCDVRYQKDPIGESRGAPVIKCESQRHEKSLSGRSWAPGVWVSGVWELKREE
jgi:hypothetical protein